MTWRWLAEHWRDVANDLHAVYGVDVADGDLMRARTWRWLETRILGLLARRTATTWAALSQTERGDVLRGERGPWA